MATVTTGPQQRSVTRRGFTLIELLISFVLLALAFLVAAQLLHQTQQRFAAEGRRARDPLATIALSRLRWDVQAAASLRTGSSSELFWSSDVLELRGHPLGTVRYFKLGNELRREISVDGSPTTRVVLRGVSRWRWRYVEGALRQLVEIELGVWETGPVVGGSRQAPDVVEKTYSLEAAARGGGGRAW